VFKMSNLPVTYGVGSAPLVFNQTGVRRFCSEEDGVLHFDPNTAGVNEQPCCPSFTAIMIRS
jgi:hypothetical protein